jgi:hypothetical protein
MVSQSPLDLKSTLYTTLGYRQTQGVQVVGI